MSAIDKIKAKAKSKVMHIVLPEGTEPRTVQATRKITDQGIAKVTLLGNPDEVKKVAAETGTDLTGVEIIDPKTSETMDFDAQPGFCILGGVVNDAFGDGEDKITLMVLADSGELLILSGYNLARDHHALYLFLTALLEATTMDGDAVYAAPSAEPQAT